MMLRRSLPISVLALLCLSGAVQSVTGVDWPQFRGPNQNGSASGSGFDRETFGLAVDWQRELGSGYSGISVVGERGVTMATDGTVDFVTAFAVESGRELWRYELGPMYEGHGGSHDGPISTPAIDGGVVYALGPRGRLAAIRLTDGTVIWERELDGEPGARQPTWGYATTPLVVDGMLIVLTGGADGHAVTAFRRRDGEPIWSQGSDTVGYQSPVLVELHGRRQLVVATNNEIAGLDPAAGSMLWHHSFGDRQEDGFGQPVVFDDDRILVNSWDEALLFEVEREGDDFQVAELWRSRELRRSYALAVHADNHLFGFNGRFLVCLDPDTGKAVWKSRPPGGRGLILVDDHLVLTSFEGDLVVAEATSAGYRETARLPLLEHQSYTTPSFAGSHLYVRDLERLARVRITERPTPGMITDTEETTELAIPDGRFGAFLSELLASDSKRRLVDEFIAAQSSFPIIEDEGTVHFVFRGEVEDIALTGSMLGDEEERVLQRIPGTDLLFTTLELDPEGHWEYRFSIFGDTRVDPLNPHQIGSLAGQSSELRMPGWPAPDHLGEPTGPRGRVESFDFESRVTGNERQIQVYLPAGYDQGNERYPVVLYNNGDSALEDAQLDRSLDNLMGTSVVPAIVVLLPRVGQEFGGSAADRYVELLVTELLPLLDRRYRTLRDPATRAIMGVGSGGYISAYAAFKAPGTFGKVATQSLYRNQATWESLVEAVSEGEKQGLDFYIEWSRHDYLVEEAGIDAARDSQELAELLASRGYSVRRNLVTGAAGWGSWRAQIDTILEGFYPLSEAAGP